MSYPDILVTNEKNDISIKNWSHHQSVNYVYTKLKDINGISKKEEDINRKTNDVWVWNIKNHFCPLWMLGTKCATYVNVKN